MKEVRRTINKTTSVCNRGGVPQAYLTLKKEDYNGCASNNQWSKKWGCTSKVSNYEEDMEDKASCFIISVS
jgi:hypothetical protein